MANQQQEKEEANNGSEVSDFQPSVVEDISCSIMLDLKIIPLEIMVEILARLPVATLGQCRCVCKSWHLLIAEPFFVKKQLYISDREASCSINQEESSFFILQHAPGCGASQMSFYSLYCSDKLVEAKRINSPIVNEEEDFRREGSFRLHGSSNGLLCLSYFKLKVSGPWGDIVLWNPSINKFKILAESPSISMNRVYPSLVVLGFAFIPDICEYKVVRLVYGRCPRVFPLVEVYNLSTDSWRNVSAAGDNLPFKLYEESPRPLINGAVHWMAYRTRMESRKRKSFIMSFQMVDEVFREIKMPAYTGSCEGISAFRDSLALFVCNPKFTVGSWEIWVMTDYGNIASWSKHFSLRDMGSPFAFMMNGCEAILRRNCFELVSYDPKSQKVRNLKVPPWASVMVPYKESLALLNDRWKQFGGCSERMWGSLKSQ